MSGAQLGEICGCSGLTGGQYLSSVTATRPEEVETMRELPCRCIRYQVIIFYPQPTYSKQNSFFYFGKNVVFLQRSFSRQRITKTGTMRPNSRQDYQNKPFAKKRWICWTHWPYCSCASIFTTVQHSFTLKVSRRRQLTHISARLLIMDNLCSIGLLRSLGSHMAE